MKTTKKSELDSIKETIRLKRETIKELEEEIREYKKSLDKLK